jgi:hypothetical protein
MEKSRTLRTAKRVSSYFTASAAKCQSSAVSFLPVKIAAKYPKKQPRTIFFARGSFSFQSENNYLKSLYFSP